MARGSRYPAPVDMSELHPVTPAARLAHARREFDDALDAHQQTLTRVARAKAVYDAELTRAETAASAEHLLTVQDVATRLAVSADHVRGLTKRGALDCVRAGATVRYRPGDVASFLEARG